mgnify:CR=1 FL=1
MPGGFGSIGLTGVDDLGLCSFVLVDKIPRFDSLGILYVPLDVGP